MLPSFFTTAALLLGLCCSQVVGLCDSYSPAFPLPKLRPDDPLIKNAYHAIKESLDKAIGDLKLTTTSFSIEVTSSIETLFELHHTAEEYDEQRPGAKKVDGSSCYRIASITKPYTVLAILQQHIAGNLSLDDPINLYIPELGEKSKRGVPWKDITIRTLASQLSGIPRDIAQADLLAIVEDPTKYGLPPVPKKVLEQCDVTTNYSKPCDAKDLLDYLSEAAPIFPPKQESTYSNLNYELLGLALENVTGIPYEDYVHEHVLKKLGLSSTSFSKPPDAVAVLPKGQSYYWDIDIGVQNPTGGLYSTSADMAKFARYVLTHYNGLTPALNWFNPVSYATGVSSFYGIPWEIFRPANVFPHTARPITLVMKGGSLPAYTSLLVMSPEYGFGAIVLVAGEPEMQAIALSRVFSHMLSAAETMAQRQMSQSHTGTFVAGADLHINSSITISHSPSRGLYISSWISNSTDIMQTFRGLLGQADNVRYQLVPTLLFKDEVKQEGEIWRILPVEEADTVQTGSEFCLTDIDLASYGGLPLTEVVFWSEGNSQYQVVEPSAFRIKLNRGSKRSTESSFRQHEYVHDDNHVQQIVQAKMEAVFPDMPRMRVMF